MIQKCQHDGKLNPTMCKQIGTKKKKLHFLQEQEDNQTQTKENQTNPQAESKHKGNN